jgi:hypothetical protein
MAATFLHTATPQHARLALILCDNVVELLAHERCQWALAKDRYWITGKLSNAERAAARGQDFAPKLNFLVKQGEIAPTERDYAIRAHGLRNEAYHTAYLHDGIAWAVAWHYHELACTLFARLEPAMIEITEPRCSPSLEGKFRAAGLLGDRLLGGRKDGMAMLVRLLQSAKPAQRKPLGEVLAEVATERFDELLNSLRFLVENGPDGATEDAALHEVYFFTTLDREEIHRGLDLRSDQGRREFNRRLTAAKVAYQSPLRASRIQKWLERARDLSTERDVTAALIRYTDLIRESDEAVEFISEAASQLDAVMQNEIDRMRGK